MTKLEKRRIREVQSSRHWDTTIGTTYNWTRTDENHIEYGEDDFYL